MSCRPALVWGGILAAGVAAEAHALLQRHHDCTLSAMTRSVFRTEQPAGRAAFVLGSAAFAVWFQYHIVTWRDSLTDDGLAQVFELDPSRAPEQYR
jgi:hypothetical protein